MPSTLRTPSAWRCMTRCLIRTHALMANVLPAICILPASQNGGGRWGSLRRIARSRLRWWAHAQVTEVLERVQAAAAARSHLSGMSR